MNQADRLKEYIEQLRKDAYEEGVKDATKEMSKQIGVIVCIAVMAFCILAGDLDELEEREGQR